MEKEKIIKADFKDNGVIMVLTSHGNIYKGQVKESGYHNYKYVWEKIDLPNFK